MAILYKISGPVVVAKEVKGGQINELVHVGQQRLLGEIISLKEDTASIQVYEDTAGLRPGEPVELTGYPLSIELGPGLLSTVYDGIQRPLNEIREKSGDFITKGIYVPALNRDKKWEFTPTVKNSQEVVAGDVLGTVIEYNLVHKIMVPDGVKGKVSQIKAGSFTVTQQICLIDNTPITMMQRWPVRKPRPIKEKKHFELPLVTGKRIMDSFFPIAKGGAAAIPGPFGSGKTVNQTDLAKYSDANIIVYVGCGERGNEMTEVLETFPKLIDPTTKKPLMERTILVANTSNMPVSAREASIYTGITIAEYYRDMGYDVALMADSTSRWAEAMREISGRMEEMPGEEGYPAYLGKRLAEFYERAGRVGCSSSDDKPRNGSISAIGAVSPPGGDLSEPVSQSTLRVARVFWALDSSLAKRRHYPAINWLKSYSLYLPELKNWYLKNVADDFYEQRAKALFILQKESELQNIVQLIGPDALPESERLVLEAAKMIREDFLQQNAYDELDAYTSLKKQYWMIKTILYFYDSSIKALSNEIPLQKIVDSKIKTTIAKLKYTKDDEIQKTCSIIFKDIDTEFSSNVLRGE